jgi:hypothetical protein
MAKKLMVLRVKVMYLYACKNKTYLIFFAIFRVCFNPQLMV